MIYVGVDCLLLQLGLLRFLLALARLDLLLFS